MLSCAGEVLGKPGDHDAAVAQLQKMSGLTSVFSTGLCVISPGAGSADLAVVDYSVSFRKLEIGEIERYLGREQPYDCAGSFKSERLGVTLIEAMHGDDPTALIGLPLIELSAMLRRAGYSLP